MFITFSFSSKDPFGLRNLINLIPESWKNTLHSHLTKLIGCVGSIECNHLMSVPLHFPEQKTFVSID